MHAAGKGYQLHGEITPHVTAMPDVIPQQEIVGPTGALVHWKGFWTGPVVLSEAQLRDICHDLLSADWDEIENIARRELVPTLADTGEPSIFMHSATPLKKFFEAELDSLASGGHGEDVPTYLETRAVSLAEKGDMVLGRSTPWRKAVEDAGVEAVEIPDRQYYYLTHALLAQATRYTDDRDAGLGQIIHWLRARPRTVIRVYVLDRETQAFLIWLKRVSGLSQLLVEANGVDIAGRWYEKAPLHPTVEAARSVEAELSGADAFTALGIESTLTPFVQELNLYIPRLPGYTIMSTGAEPVRHQLREAARLLRNRFGLTLGCFKPSRAGTGARIEPAVPLHSSAAIEALADKAEGTGEDYELEAHANYVRTAVEGLDFILAPSMHIRGNGATDGMTVQITQGTQWSGNVSIDKLTCQEFGISSAQYDFIQKSTTELIDAFQGRGPGLTLLTGGIDFAIARVGGRFDHNVLIGVQDLNLSTCGADSLITFLSEARKDRKWQDIERLSIYAATKVIKPGRLTDLSQLRSTVDVDIPGLRQRALTCVPGRWGLLAAAATAPRTALRGVLSSEKALSDRSLLADEVLYVE